MPGIGLKENRHFAGAGLIAIKLLDLLTNLLIYEKKDLPCIFNFAVA